MKKLLLIIVSFFLYLNVYAVDIPACTTSEMSRLKELANNVQFKVDSEISEEKELEIVTKIYTLDIVNLDNDLQIKYMSDNTDEDLEDSKEVTITSTKEVNEAFFPSQTVEFKIYAYTANRCTGRLLKTVKVKFPYFNSYYYFNKEKCSEYPNFKYCNESADISNYTIEELDELFDNYIKKENEIIQTQAQTEINWYLVLGIGAGVIVIVTILIVVIRKRIKNRDSSI